MISVPGTINIRSIEGRFGSFNVGTLECSIGSFTVKDSSIEEFDEGSYTGDFVIEKIKPNSYFHSGRMVVEVRAFLSAIMLKRDAPPQPVLAESFEQDPLEEDMADLPVGHHAGSGNSAHFIEDAPVLDEDSALQSLFGFLYPLGNCVKLDPTINRALFRQQKDHLKANGYRFVASEQHWIKE